MYSTANIGRYFGMARDLVRKLDRKCYLCGKFKIMSNEERIRHLEQRMDNQERKRFIQSVAITILSITVFLLAIRGTLI